MCYFLLRQIFLLAVKVYFRKVVISNENAITAGGPILLVANHTSALMDAILLAVISRRPIHFLTRGESFDKAWKRWLWGQLHMIPIYRRAFTPELVKNNDHIFRRCSERLQENRIVAIFPEGKSKVDKNLGVVKTGAARILLGSAATNNYDLSIRLLPVGINYANPHQFRSEVMVNFGPAIPLQELYAMHAEEPEQAVRLLTTEIKNSIAGLLMSDNAFLPTRSKAVRHKLPYPKFIFNEMMVAYARFNHYYMLKSTSWLVHRICKRPDFYGSLQLGLGTVVFITCYFVQVIGIFWLTASAALAIAYLLSLVISGWWALESR